VRRSDLLDPGSGQHEKRRLQVKPKQIAEPLQGVLVAPLYVVEEQQPGRPVPERGAGQGLEEAAALPLLNQRLGGRRSGLPGRQFREDTPELHPPDRIQALKTGGDGRSPEPVGHRAEREAPLRRVAARTGDGNPLTVGPGEKLLGQARLADAGLPANHR
jgi:hypothetical protein